MQGHEYFEELCALVPIGQLRAEEYRELSEHLTMCSNCRHATEDFSLILDQLPIGEVDVDDQVLLDLQGNSYRDRFLRRARVEGVPLTNGVTRTAFGSKWRRWPQLRIGDWMIFAAVASILVISITTYWTVLQRSNRKPAALAVQAMPPMISPDTRRYASEIAELQKKIEGLEGETREQKQVIADLESNSSRFKQESESTQSDLAKAGEHLGQLNSELEATNKSLAAARTEAAVARTAKDDADAALVAQQFKLTELSDQVKSERANVERERQLTAAAQEVRGLMGARNLHIIDVSDVDSSGKSKKSFGRVFFTEGKSLIFYAFDLGHKGNASKVSFQAWGQWEGQDKVAQNLGVFYVDDNVQKRWVLKVDDPEKLKAINSLFVTVEPLGGADRPTGKKLLYAYLGTQANHP